jgi:hypothetical protein
VPARKPIEGNRRHDVLVSGADARAMETAATALTDADNITETQAEAAGKRLREVAKRYRDIDRPAARKAAKVKKAAGKKD